MTVSAVTPSSGTVGTAVPVTIDGGGFASGATVSAGAGITVSSVAFVSATRLTATFTIDGAASPGARDVTVTNLGASGATLTSGFVVKAPVTVALSLVYNGKLRDRVGGGDAARAGDGAADGTLTLSAAGGRTVTALRLQNGIGGTWDTTAPNSYWLLGVAPSLDGALLNNATTMAVNASVPDGGSLVLFASDYNGGAGFALGRTLTVTATFSDGTTSQAVTTVSVGVTAVTPNKGTAGTAVPVTIDGSGFASGATVDVGTGITVSNVAFVSATRLTATFTIASGTTGGARSVTVTNPGGSGGALTNGFTVTLPPAVTLTLTYNGKLRDRVGGGDTARVADGQADGTMTMTLSAAGGRTVTALRLQNGYGVWDTTAPNSSWLLGVASSLDGPLLNDATTMAVNVAVPDGGSLVLFASDYGGGQAFVSGRTLTLTANFSDGTSASCSVVVP